MQVTRRVFLTALTALAASPAKAAAGDFVLDWGDGVRDPEVERRLDRQIAMVRQVPVSAEVAAFWARETIHVQPRPGMPSRAGQWLFITRDAFADDQPVLLHELIHRWHLDRLANRPRVAPLRAAFAAERAAPHWPPSSYMYENISEYLAMCGSVVIHGSAARPPFTRNEVRQRLPATFDFIVAEFGLRL